MHIDISVLQTLCQNVSAVRGPDPDSAAGDGRLNGLYPEVNLTQRELDFQRERDRHAFLYIVVVLIFYSFGIIIAIIMYLKREKEEIVEEKAYDDYMNFRSDPDKRARYFRVQLMINRLNKVQREKERRQCEEDGLENAAGDNRTPDSSPPSCSRSAEVLDVAVTHSSSEESASSLELTQARADVGHGLDEQSAAVIGKHRSETLIYEAGERENHLLIADTKKHHNTL